MEHEPDRADTNEAKLSQTKPLHHSMHAAFYREDQDGTSRVFDQDPRHPDLKFIEEKSICALSILASLCRASHSSARRSRST
jgi:hypothetical protein